MPDRRIEGKTVEESDREEINQVLTNIEEHRRVRLGLPIKDHIIDGQVYPPESLIGTSPDEVEETTSFTQDTYTSGNSVMHIVEIKTQKWIGRNIGPKEYEEIKKAA